MDYSVLLGWLPAPFVLYVCWVLLKSKAAEILKRLDKIEAIETSLAGLAVAVRDRVTHDEHAQLRERVAVLEARRKR